MVACFLTSDVFLTFVWLYWFRPSIRAILPPFLACEQTAHGSASYAMHRLPCTRKYVDSGGCDCFLLSPLALERLRLLSHFSAAVASIPQCAHALASFANSSSLRCCTCSCFHPICLLASTSASVLSLLGRERACHCTSENSTHSNRETTAERRINDSSVCRCRPDGNMQKNASTRAR